MPTPRQTLAVRRSLLVVAMVAATALAATPVTGTARAEAPASARRQPATTGTATGSRPQPGGSVAWRPEGRLVLGQPVVYRGSVGGVEVAWLDPTFLRLAFVPGTADPGGPWSWGGVVPPQLQGQLVAAFNGGFQLKDTPGGWYAEGRVLKGLVPGEASLVIYQDGRVTVGQWGRDVDLTPDVVVVRQNLGLLVDNGRPVPSADNPSAWGGSVAGVATARSGFGVDANGGLVVAEARVSPRGLADALVAAGAVRAMQLDINPDWVTFVLYDANGDGSVSGRRVMGTGGPSSVFLAPYSRDFFAVLIKPSVAPGAKATLGATPVKARVKVA